MNQASLEHNMTPLPEQMAAVVSNIHRLSELQPCLRQIDNKMNPVPVENDIAKRDCVRYKLYSDNQYLTACFVSKPNGCRYSVALPEAMEAIVRSVHYLAKRQLFLDQVRDKASKDIAVAHRRRWPNRPMSLASRILLLLMSPGLQVLLIHRLAHGLYLARQQNNGRHKGLWRIMSIPIGLLNLTMVKIRTKSHVRNDCEIEGGVFFSDQGNTIFGAKKAGAGTVIGPRVTVGMSHADMGRPVIGRNVWISSDCVLYGAINIGDGATLLPGTVLTKTIPAGVVMQGNPARLVARNFDNSELRKRQNADAMCYINAKQGEG